jgi:hypothetical protein
MGKESVAQRSAGAKIVMLDTAVKASLAALLQRPGKLVIRRRPQEQNSWVEIAIVQEGGEDSLIIYDNGSALANVVWNGKSYDWLDWVVSETADSQVPGTA